MEINIFNRQKKESTDQIAIAVQEGYAFLKERIAELEFALEDREYVRINDQSEGDFSVEAFKKINKLAKLYYLKNPLLRRAVVTQTTYTFGQGVTYEAEQRDINEVIQRFIDNNKNQKELFDHSALMQKEIELQLYGNLYFVLFIDGLTGNTLIRTIHPNEIVDIVSDPEDRRTILYYKRSWSKKIFSTISGQYEIREMITYYPDIENRNPAKTIGGKPVEVSPIFHVKVNSLSDMKFGVSEIYSAIDWAKAYKGFLEDWTSVVNALSKFAFALKTKRGKTGIDKAKEMLDQRLTGNETTQNFAPSSGSVFIGGSDDELKPIKTSGATVSVKDGRYLLLMVCSATGIFEHYLTGDPSTGNLATAKAMERPMEILFKNRQKLWTDIFKTLFGVVIKESVRAPKGLLSGKGKIVFDEYFDAEKVIMQLDKENTDEELRQKPISLDVRINFPEVLEKDTAVIVESIETASKVMIGMGNKDISDKIIMRLLLTALSVENPDKYMEAIFKKEEGAGAIGNKEEQEIIESAKKLKTVIGEALRSTHAKK